MQRRVALRSLFVRGVDARRRGEEETVRPVLPRRHQQVRVDQHRQHAQGAVVFDEAHAAHVGREVVDDGGLAARRLAGLFVLQVQLQILDLGKTLIPVARTA